MSNEKMREEFELAWQVSMSDDEGNLGWKPTRSKIDGDKYAGDAANFAWLWWQRARATVFPDGHCIVPSETIKKAYALASSVCGDCYSGEDTESLLANQLAREISKSGYWMSVR